MDEKKLIHSIIEQALSEDIGETGDITSKALFSKDDRGEAVIKSKERGVLSGVYLIEPLYKTIDSNVTVKINSPEAALLERETEICRLNGPIQSILAGERTVLNFLQRLSGIATETDRLVSLIKGTKTSLLDTRKTTPMLRLLEKRAVLAGGGKNHRFGLYDMILLKDTHVKAAGGVSAAIQKAKTFVSAGPSVAIEVEVQSMEEFREAVAADPDRIMLDNMSVEEMADCVSYVRKMKSAVELEASGNVTAENIGAIAETGVDFISAGSVTHSARALDIHLVLI